MEGKVAAINLRSGMAAVLTEAGDFSTLELQGLDAELGDTLRWGPEDDPLGEAAIRNVTRKSRMQVYFQNHGVQRAELKDHFDCDDEDRIVCDPDLSSILVARRRV